MADLDNLDPNDKDALNRALYQIVAPKRFHVITSKDCPVSYFVSFDAAQGRAALDGSPVRGLLWRGTPPVIGNQRSTYAGRQFVGTVDVALHVRNSIRLLDVTVDLVRESTLVPIPDHGGVHERRDDKDFRYGPAHDQILRRSVAMMCETWLHKTVSSRCVVRSSDIYLPHYLREAGYLFVADDAGGSSVGRVPVVASRSEVTAEALPNSLVHTLRSAFVRQQALDLLAVTDEAPLRSGLQRLVATRRLTRSVCFVTRHQSADAGPVRHVTWYVPDTPVNGSYSRVSVDLIARAANTLDRAAQVLGPHALPSTVVFARPRSHASDFLTHSPDLLAGRVPVDGTIHPRYRSVFLLDEGLIAMPYALMRHRDAVLESNRGWRLATELLPVEEAVATLAWRRSLNAGSSVGRERRQRVHRTIRQLVDAETAVVLQKVADVNESFVDTLLRSEFGAHLGSRRAARSEDAFIDQLFVHWLNNPLARQESEVLMHSLGLADARPAWSL